jgi:hypothetical protein
MVDSTHSDHAVATKATAFSLRHLHFSPECGVPVVADAMLTKAAG